MNANYMTGRLRISLLPCLLISAVAVADESNLTLKGNQTSLTGVTVAAETNLTVTIDGTVYHNVRFGRVTPVEVTLFHSAGVATIPLAKLPSELQKQLGYSPEKAAEWQDAQRKQQADQEKTRIQQEVARRTYTIKYLAAAIDSFPEGTGIIVKARYLGGLSSVAPQLSGFRIADRDGSAIVWAACYKDGEAFKALLNAKRNDVFYFSGIKHSAAPESVYNFTVSHVQLADTSH
ncbi:MAG TPA: hypothetical protein VL171_17765 [Verrucomicrobiae bacterium]|nr:hypothetical protein [Verrucomicrobiae bacterium]